MLITESFDHENVLRPIKKKKFFFSYYIQTVYTMRILVLLNSKTRINETEHSKRAKNLLNPNSFVFCVDWFLHIPSHRHWQIMRIALSDEHKNVEKLWYSIVSLITIITTKNLIHFWAQRVTFKKHILCLWVIQIRLSFCMHKSHRQWRFFCVAFVFNQS